MRHPIYSVWHKTINNLNILGQDEFKYLSLYRFEGSGILGLSYTEGTGTLTVNNSSNILSLSGGNLTANGTPNPATTIYEDFNRIAGRAFYVEIPTRTAANNSPRVGMGDQNVTHLYPGVWIKNPTTLSVVSAETVLYDYVPGSGTWQLLSIAHATGGVVLVKRSAEANYTLLWRENTKQTGLRMKQYYFATIASNIKFDNWKVRDLGSSYADWKQSISHIAWPTSGDIINTTADMFLEFTWIPVAGEVLSLLFRRTDDNNTLKIECDQAAGTIKLFDRQGGIDTEYGAGKLQTWTAGTTYRVAIIGNGTNIKSFVNTTLKHNSTITYNSTVVGSKVSGFTLAKGYDYASWPLVWNDPFGAVSPPPRLILPYGDSYTFGTGDSIPPAAGKNGYPPLMIDILNTGIIQYAELSRVGKGGYTAWQLQLEVDADIAGRLGVSPYAVLIDVGQNDLAAMPTKANWLSYMGYILNAFHVAYPNARLLVARIYSPGYLTETALVDNDWIPSLLALYPYAEYGIDRRYILNHAGDLDGSEHPTRQGYTRMANAYVSLLQS